MIRGISVVVPVADGARYLDEVVGALVREGEGRDLEVIVVDDGSQDDSVAIARRWAIRAPVRVLSCPGRGAAAAINAGLLAARHGVVCQVDQDVIVAPGWLDALLGALEDPTVGAAQGQYIVAAGASVWARLARADLALRWASLRDGRTDHVCTGNTAYRAEALRRVGGLDETLGYGYDNDLSYRLGSAGYSLVYCPGARAVHRFRTGVGPYLRQQYGLGYGRLDVIAKHPRRVRGDRVSGLAMILHVPGTLGVLVAGGAAGVLALVGGPWRVAAGVAVIGAGLLALERAVAAVRAARLSRDAAALLILPAHLLRDLAWVAAAAVWGWRRLLRRPSRPGHSMRRT